MQKVNYGGLINDSDDESGSDFGKAKKPFDSDDEDELMDNAGIKEASMHQAGLDDSNDMFEEESPKKPTKRKLGAKPDVVKDPSSKTSAKRTKKMISDSEEDSPIKVIVVELRRKFLIVN